MKCKASIVCLLILIILAAPSTARSLPNRRRMAEREVTREANLDNSADEIASKNPKVENFITELANLSIPHYLKDIYLNFSSSDGDVGANTIRSYENTAKSELYITAQHDVVTGHSYTLTTRCLALVNCSYRPISSSYSWRQ